MGGEVKGHTVQTMVGREERVEGPRTQMVEGELGLGGQVVPAVRGKVMWADEKMAMTWFLVVRIARSAGLERFLKGGTYWKVRLTERKKEVRSDEVSLSRRR